MGEAWKDRFLGEFQCAQCGALYEVAITLLSAPVYDEVTCEVCRRVMNEWRGTVGRAYTLEHRACLIPIRGRHSLHRPPGGRAAVFSAQVEQKFCAALQAGLAKAGGSELLRRRRHDRWLHDPLWTAHDRPAARRTYRRERKLTWGDAPFWAPHLFSEPSLRLSRGPSSPSLNFARVRRAGVVEGLSCYLPMRFVPIGKPHVHHERISVVGAFDPICARLWFQSHRDKSHSWHFSDMARCPA
jgi:hypothetical protein